MNNHHQAPDLGSLGKVAVVDWRILPANGVDVKAGGLTNPQAVAYLQLIDIPHSAAYLAPIELRQLRNLRDQCETLLATQ